MRSRCTPFSPCKSSSVKTTTEIKHVTHTGSKQINQNMATRKGGGTDEQESDDDPDHHGHGIEESLDTSESMEEIDAKDVTVDEDETSIEMISGAGSDDSPFASPSRSVLVKVGEAVDYKLSGWLKLPGFGFRKAAKNVWFVYGEDTGKLYYYRQPQDLLPLGEIDVCNSSFTYNANNRDKPGLFEIRAEDKVHTLEAEDRVHMLYWLESLQNKRRQYNHRRSNITQDLQLILTGRKQHIASGLLARNDPDGGSAIENSNLCQDGGQNLISHEIHPGGDAGKSWSLLNLREEIRKSMSLLRRGETFSVHYSAKNRQVTSDEWTVVDDPPTPPEFPITTPSGNSEWHVPTPTSGSHPLFFPTTDTSENLSQQSHIKSKATKNSTETHQSTSKSKNDPSQCHEQPIKSPSSPPASTCAVSPPPPANGRSRLMSAIGSKFKMMKDNVKEKGLRPLGPSKSSSFSGPSDGGSMDILDSSISTCSRCYVLNEDILNAKEDLKVAEDELAANREIVRLLQKEVDYMRQQILTRNECDGMEEEALMQVLHQKDKHVVELEHSMAAIVEEKHSLQQSLQMENNALKELKEQISMFQQTLAVKDEMIVSLTNQNQELKNNNQQLPNKGESLTTYMSDPVSLVAERKEMERLQVTCQAFEEQNAFLTKEIVELNTLRQEDEMRERHYIMNIATLKAEHCKVMSKYLFLLKEKQTPVRGGEDRKSQEVVSQLLEEALASEAVLVEEHGDDDKVDSKTHSFLSSQGKEYDQFGFLTSCSEEDDILVTRANMLQRKSVEMENLIRDRDEQMSKHIKWENFMVGQNLGKPLTRSNDLKSLIRLGVPHEFRERIWRGCINNYVISDKDKLGKKYYHDLEQRAKANKLNPANKQIELDLLRTLPENRFFDKMDSPGIQKLRRVLLCYSVHNPGIGYCQGLNRIAAIALLFLCEEDAFWCMVAIIDHLMPHEYYTTTLAAAQADQRVLKDLIQDKCPRLHSHLETHEVDLSLFTFNWFLTVFVDGVRPELFLRVWDCFLYEGSKVLFRFALAFLKYSEDEILQQRSNLAINRHMRTLGENLIDVKKIIHLAFHGLNPFPMRGINSKRHNHMQQIKIELEELEAIRKEFKDAHDEEDRRNVTRKPSNDYMSDDDLDDV